MSTTSTINDDSEMMRMMMTTGEDDIDKFGLPSSQYIPLVLLQIVFSFLSILSSIVVLRIARGKLSSSYQRLVLTFTIAVVFVAITFIIQPFLVPPPPTSSSSSSQLNYSWAVGNDTSCTAVGFLLVMSTLCLGFYSIMLALYFYFSIQTTTTHNDYDDDDDEGKQQTRQKQSEEIIGGPEWIGHTFCWVGSAALASAGIGLEEYELDPTINMCILSQGNTNDDNNSSNSQSTNGLLRRIYQWVLFGTVIGTIAVTLIIQLHVRRTLRQIAVNDKKRRRRRRRERRRGGGNDDDIDDDDDELDPDGNDSANEQEQIMKQKFSAVAIQGGLYTTTYSACTIFFVILLFLSSTITATTNTNGDFIPNLIYSFQILTALMYPMMGIFNCVIYVRPRVQMLQIMYPQDPFLITLRVGMSTAGDAEEIEDIRAYLYGSDYYAGSVTSQHMVTSQNDGDGRGDGGGVDDGVSEMDSIGSLPSVVHLEGGPPTSIRSLVSTPGDADGNDNGGTLNDSRSVVSPIADPEDIPDPSHMDHDLEVEQQGKGIVAEGKWKRATPLGLYDADC